MLSAAAPAAAEDIFALWPFAPPPAAEPHALPSMSCAEAIGLVKTLGSVRLADAGGAAARYVPEASACRSASARNVWVRTRDIAACPVGFVCEGFFGAY